MEMYFISTCNKYDIVEKDYKIGLNVTKNYKIRYHISSLEQIFEGRNDYKNVVCVTIPKNDNLYKKNSNHYSYIYQVNIIDVKRIYELDNYEDVKSLVEMGVNINKAVSNIIISNNINTLKYLLEKGANINLIESCVAKFGNLELFQLLLENKCDLGKFLPVAAEYGQFELVKFLVENGVYIDYIDYIACAFSKCTPLVEASSSGHTEIVRYLIDNGAEYKKSHGILLAAKYGHHDVVKLFIEKGADLNEYGFKCIEEVVKKNNIEILKLLINCGIEIDYEYLIYVAGLLGYTKLVRYLINIEKKTITMEI
ncbi:ankyrin repeat protein [Megavirus chiliensis]|uniref:Ankyrin repeat protein n=2 Tax=Megamimivirinae TaxID=3044648 RepID=A0A2L2DL30_MIMIV|nr:putative ankyrin repeat protein [Megavirus chiliensis]AEQ33353.1 ankyrin repeat protein [Megavirus chiliensis]AVG46876.1 ankyrin repeat protein [Acanthamoeba polyphaga mimivirus]